MDISIGSSLSGGGASISTSVTRSADSVESLEPNSPTGFPAGKTVTAWVKTDANTAACNLPAGHGQTNGKFDVYWAEGAALKRRYGVDGVITTNALALDGGAGDDFPASATVGVVVTKQIRFNVGVRGNDLVAFGMNLALAGSSVSGRGSVSFYDAADALLVQVNLPMPPVDVQGGSTNILSGMTVAYAMASNASPSAVGTLKVLIGQDSTP